MLTTAICLLLASSFPSAQETASSANTQLAEITYLANAGFLIRSGPNAVMVDAFVPMEVTGLEALADPARKAMLAAEAPFDRPLISLVSHAHPDHIKAPFAQRVLWANAKAFMISSEEVIRLLSSGGKNWEPIKNRAAAFSRNRRNEPLPFVDQENGLAITFLDLPHVEGAEDGIVNIGHLVRMQDFKFLHLGDAAADLNALEKFKLAEREIDVALVPYWFYSSEQGIKAIDDVIKAKHVVVYHIPAAEKAKFSAQLKQENPTVIVFGELMERKIFEVQKKQ